MPTEKNIKSPQKLWEYFEAYKKKAKESPKYENFWSSKSDKEVSVKREIPLTWVGFQVWLHREGIISKLDDYRSNKDNRYSEYADIIRAIGDEIFEDQYDGASAGIFQHNIIARNLGLVDKKEVDKPQKTKRTLNEINKRQKEIMDKLNLKKDE